MNTTSHFNDVISQLELRPDAINVTDPLVLMWHFSEAARQEVCELREKNSEGLIAPAEYDKLDAYRRVGHLLDMMLARARSLLRNDEPNA